MATKRAASRRQQPARRVTTKPLRPGSVRHSSKKSAQEIIDTAAEIFHAQGYANSSVHDIAESLGILKGSLYYYISSKEDLLFEVLADVHEGAWEIVEANRALEGVTSLERLRDYVRRHVEYNARNLTKIGVFYHDYRALSPKRLKDIIGRRRQFETYVEGLIRDAQDDGYVHPDIDTKMAAFGIFGMMNWVYHWYRPGGPWKPEQIGELYAQMAVDGLRGAAPA